MVALSPYKPTVRVAEAILPALFGCVDRRSITIPKVVDLQSKWVNADAVKSTKQINNSGERKIRVRFQE
jgi:hypothetical protein